jgi:hypothetical protein
MAGEGKLRASRQRMPRWAMVIKVVTNTLEIVR